MGMPAIVVIGNLGDRWEVALTNGSDRWIQLQDGFKTRESAQDWADAAALDFGLRTARASIVTPR